MFEFYSPSRADTYPVLLWWACLSFLAVVNLYLIRSAHQTLIKRRKCYDTWLRNIRNQQFSMSSIYVGGCAFRSVIPCDHTLRRVLVKSFISTGFVGRSVATVAELGAAMQVSILLHEIGSSTNDRLITTTSKLVFPILFVAEIFSWYACLTTNYIGSILEESLWAACALLLLVSLIRDLSVYIGKEQRDFIYKACTVDMLYFTYMVFVDVPYYIKGHIANTSSGKVYPSVSDGLDSLLNISKHELTWSYDDWRYAMCWMTLYFSVACWASIGVVNAPRMDQGLVTKKG